MSIKIGDIKLIIDPWIENPYYPVSEWQDEVRSNDTRLGYADWVVHQEEADDYDEQNL